MPLLQSGTERFALQAGTYTLGGRGPNAVPLASLECLPEVAAIVVPPSGVSTLQRLTASVVVRLNRTPIGIGPKELPNGVEIEFSGCRLTFTTDEAGEASVSSESTGEEPDTLRLFSLPPAPPSESTGEEADTLRLFSRPAAPPSEPTPHVAKARLLNMRTGDAIDLGDNRVVVGRDEGCDIRVPGMAVSRRHCSITPVQGGYLLRDESVNGTLVNGSRVTGTYLLGHGDIVRVADEELRFEVERGTQAASGTTAAPTMILDMSRLRAGEAAAAGAPERPTAPLVATLEIVRGPYSGASFSIDRPVCSIGRSAASDVRIRDESVSTSHATLLRKGRAWFVVDLRSANGTFVDGLRIAGERELTSGSRLRLGRVELVFRALDTTVEFPVETARPRSRLLEWVRPLFSRSSGTPSDDV